MAHILADFTFQSKNMAKDKNLNGFKSTQLKWHILIVFITSALLSFQLKFIIASLIIAIIHWIIDGIKPQINKSKYLGKYAFFIDQSLHIGVLILICFLFNKYIQSNSYLPFSINSRFLVILIGFILTGKPANIIIKEIFRVYKIKHPLNGKETSDELPNAGRLIGITERWLVLVFISFGHFEAVGFLIAAKSILRYNTKEENGFNKTEYVLIGTLLSYAIAILIGIVILKL